MEDRDSEHVGNAPRLNQCVCGMRRYEGKGAIAGVGKTVGQGVLPFVASFTSMAYQLEDLLAADDSSASGGGTSPSPDTCAPLSSQFPHASWQ